MYRYDNPQTAAIMSIGMNALRKALPSIEFEVFITNIKKDDFDYTEWRKAHLWQSLTVGEILDNASQNTKDYKPPQSFEII
jgi:hypothetical protein